MSNKVIAALAAIAFSGQIYAVPRLQLDINDFTTPYDSTYDSADQTIITSNQLFTLNAYLWDQDGNDLDPTGDFRISIALSPKVDEGAGIPDFGSFSVDGSTIDTGFSNSFGGWTHGTPPAEFHSNPDDLASHGHFDTYFIELDAEFVVGNTRNTYNTQTAAEDGFITEAGSGLMMYVDYVFDVSSLDTDNFQLHFDLYEVSSAGGVVDKAPFSHDAGTSISEPGLLALLGFGLLGIGFSRATRRS